jgi:hypothetical protein
MSSDSNPKEPREISPISLFYPGKNGKANVLQMVQGRTGDVVELFTDDAGDPAPPPPSVLAKHPSARSEEDEELPEDTEPPKPVRRKSQG